MEASYNSNRSKIGYSTKKPLPSSISKKESSGWDYWMRIYSDSNLNRSEDFQNSNVRDMHISDMLSSERLVRAKLVFLNVPGLPTGYKTIILHLLKREFNETIPVQDVIVQSGKWFINFYRPEDALRVLKKFNNFSYRNHTLIVRFCYPDGTFGDEAALAEIVESSKKSKSKLSPNNAILQDSASSEVWSPVELEAIQTFERELISSLQTNSFLPYQTAITTVRKTFIAKNFPSYFIIDALEQWMTGFIRIFHQNVKIVSNTVCLVKSSYYTQLIRDAAKEGMCAAHREPWEPFAPDEIRNEVQLKQYFFSFLCHFGPQHIYIDIPLRILAQSMYGIWPKTGYELARLITRISTGFAIINDVLYLSAHDRHREHIVANLSAYQLYNDCDNQEDIGLDFSPARIVDFDLI